MGVLLMNCLECLPIYFGILKAGALAVPLNYRYTADEIKYCLDLADVSVLVFGNRFLEKRSVQIAMMDGDADACIDYAIAVGLEKGVPAVVTETPLDAEALQAQFAARGFKATAELQVMSGPAC